MLHRNLWYCIVCPRKKTLTFGPCSVQSKTDASTVRQIQRELPVFIGTSCTIELEKAICIN